MYLGNSGTGVRLITGLLASRGLNITLVGDDSLSSRPMKRIIEPLELMNLTVQSKKVVSFKIVNKNKIPIPIEYNLKIGLHR